MMRIVATLATSLSVFSVVAAAFVPKSVWQFSELQHSHLGFRHARFESLSTELRAMQLWLDACLVCPASTDRVASADAFLVSEDEPSAVGSFLVEQGDTVHSSKPTFMKRGNKLVQESNVVGAVVDIADPTGQDAALAAMGSVEWILINCQGDWRMIPAENLIAAAKGAGTKLAVVVDRSEDVLGLSRALELGVDALCVAADASDELWDVACNAQTERQSQASSSMSPAEAKPEVVTGACWRIPNKTVLADRVCVDLVRALSPTEGCWIGSSAKTLALVLSEAATSSFVPSRPFRVNAGPVHSYILLGDGVTTKYLCEVEAGDEILVYNAETGTSRPVGVGRLKIEVRPCILVGFQPPVEEDSVESKSPAKIFLQQAETVRLGKEGGDFVRVTDLQTSSEGTAATKSEEATLLRIVRMGTHVGKAYDGKVLER